MGCLCMTIKAEILHIILYYNLKRISLKNRHILVKYNTLSGKIMFNHYNYEDPSLFCFSNNLADFDEENKAMIQKQD